MAKFSIDDIVVINNTNKIIITKYFAPSEISPMDMNKNITVDNFVMEVVSFGVTLPFGDREYVVVNNIPDELRKKAKAVLNE